MGRTAIVVLAGLLLAVGLFLSARSLLGGENSTSTTPTPAPRASATPVHTAVASLTEVHDGDNIELSTGDRFFVTLEGNVTTGYTWEISDSAGGLVRQFGQIEAKPVSNAIGAPSVQIINFEAMYGGEGDLKMIYHRPWEQNVAPAKTFTVHITVN